MANISLTSNLSNISVNTTSNVVTVSSSPVNVQLSPTSVTSNSTVRTALSVSNVSGFGNLNYDSSANSNGVFQFVGVSTSDIRAQLSNASPITYNSSTGEIGLEQSLSNITLTQYQETVVDNGTASGNVTANIANGTIHKFEITGDITGIDLTNIQSGGSATVFLTQDSIGGSLLDTTTHSSNWTNWDFVNDFTTLDTSANAFNIINVLYDGTTYFASLITDGEINPTSLSISGNITGGNIISNGVISATTNVTGTDFIASGNITSNANIEGVTLKSTGALGLVVDGNATIGGNLDVTGNINSETVVDLLVEDRNITMSYGTTGTPTANNHIFIDRGDESNTFIIWSETDDKFGFSNDGTNVTFFAEDTDGLSEGSTNLYYTTDRANSAIDDRLDGLTSVISSNSNITTTANINASNGVFEDNDNSTGTPKVVVRDTGLTQRGADYSASLTPRGITVPGLDNDNVTAISRGFSVEATNVEFFMGNIVGSTPTKMQANGTNQWFSTNPSSDFPRGQMSLTGQSQFSTTATDHTILTDEHLRYFEVTFDREIQAANGITLSGTMNGTGSIDIDGSLAGSGFTADTGGNVTAANIVGTYLHGDGSNITNLDDFTSNITTTANIQGNYIIATEEFIGDLDGAVFTHVYNNTASTLNKGKAVYLTGGNQGDQPHVDLADNTDSAKMPALGIVKENITASNDGQVATGGVINYSSHGFTQGADLYVSTAGDLTTTIPTSEDELIQKIGKVVSPNHILVQGAFRTNQTPNLDEGNIFLGSSSNTAITVTPDTNFVTAGNVFELSNSLTDINSITSETASGMTLKGQTGGIDIDKTIDSVTSKIIDIDTTGYALESADLGTANVTSDNIPGILANVSGTSGTNTLTVTPVFYAGIPGVFGFVGKQTSATAFTTWQYGSTFAGTVSANFADSNGEGWRIVPTAGGQVDGLTIRHYTDGFSANTITLSENLTANISGFHLILPGAHSSTQDLHFALTGNTDNSSIPYDYLTTLGNTYDKEQTLANVTLDKVSYGDATVDMANITMRHSADLDVGTNDAVRTDRLIMIGANATPDVLSIGEEDISPGTTALGVTLENDGNTYEAEVNTAPQTKFLINQFTENSLNSFTDYPIWTQFLGESGDANVDMKYLGAPQFNFKMVGGSKVDKKPVKSSEVVGRIAWNSVIPGVTSGSDVFHPPASIVARAPGDDDAPANLTLANVDLHLQSTYATSYRNGANATGGTIPRTFVSSNEGNTVIAAKPDGRIELKPQRDYGDEGTATSYVENRFAHKLHEYHTFLSASFANTSARTGTIVTIQDASGETGGSTDFNYDSKGNAILRLQTHEANNVVKGFWDLEFDQSAQSLHLKKDGTEEVKFTQDQTVFSNIPVMPSYSNTSLPTSVAGGIIFVTNGNNKPAYGDGTNWYYYDDTQVT